MKIKSLIVLVLLSMSVGQLMAKQKNPGVGITLKVINEYIKENPNDPNLYFVKAQILLENNKAKKAKRSLEKVICLYPKYSEAYLALAQIEIALKNYDLAQNRVNKYLSENPDNIEGKLVNGMISIATRQFDTTLNIADEILEINGENAEAYLLKGEALYELEKYDEAYESWYRSMQLGNNEAAIHLNYLFEPVW